MKLNRLFAYSLFLSLATFILVIAGGLVTSTGSGLSVPDWPLSYGQFFPPMVGGIRFEHSHRLIAATIGILTLVQMILFLRFEKRGWLKAMSVVAVLLVVLQAVLGGLTVRYLLPAPISVFHATLGQTFFAFICLIALFSSRDWKEAARVESKYGPSFCRLSLTTTLFIYFQLIAGAIVRHTQGAKAFNVHFVIAFLIAVHVVSVFLKIREEISQRKFMWHTVILGLLVVCQIFLGFGAFIYIFMIEKAAVPAWGEVLIRTAHQANGALILAASVLMTTRTCRYFPFFKKKTT